MSLVLDQVCYRESQATNPGQLLDGISFHLQPGRVTALFGPSGSGKSTLLRLLVRFLEPVSGRIELQGRALHDWDPRQLRCRVGLVGQQPQMFEGTVLANLQLPFRWQKLPIPSADSPELLQTLERCRVDPALLAKPASRLSVGQQQRVALARALLLQPRLLLLDEPTSGLDRPTADKLGATLHELAHGQQLAILLVSHDLQLLQRCADYGLFLAAGRLVEQGEMTSLFASPQSAELQQFLAGSDEVPHV